MGALEGIGLAIGCGNEWIAENETMCFARFEQNVTAHGKYNGEACGHGKAKERNSIAVKEGSIRK